MLNRFIRELRIEFYWLRKDLIRRFKLDTPVGLIGLVVLLSGLGLFVVISQGIAKIFRSAIPWVSGSAIGSIYWTSIFFALKVSFLFLLFSASIVLLLWFKSRSKR